MIFRVSDSKCTRCGICVEACPTRVVEMKDDGSVPTPTSDADERCINCGHCLSVCPHEALSLATMPLDRCLPIREDWFPEPEHFEHFVEARRSIRGFTEKNIDKDALSKLIDIARFAPTGSNSQQVEWIVVHDKKNVAEIAKMTVDYFRDQVKKEAIPNASRMERIWLRTVCSDT